MIKYKEKKMEGEFMNYKVEIKEMLARIIDIEAENEKEAIIKIKEKYRKENIILDNTDYIGTDINIYTEN